MVIPLLRVDCLRVTHPCATLLGVAPFRVRLACVKRAANVRSEPGSNSPVETVSIDPTGCGNNQLWALVRMSVFRPTGPDHSRLARLRFSFQRPMRGPDETGAEYPNEASGLGQFPFQTAHVRARVRGAARRPAGCRSWVAQCTRGADGVKTYSCRGARSFPGDLGRSGKGAEICRGIAELAQLRGSAQRRSPGREPRAWASAGASASRVSESRPHSRATKYGGSGVTRAAR